MRMPTLTRHHQPQHSRCGPSTARIGWWSLAWACVNPGRSPSRIEGSVAIVDAIFRRLVEMVRTARRRTLLGPLIHAWTLRSVVASIEGDPHFVRVLGPDEFSPYLRCLTPLESTAQEIPAGTFEWVIVAQNRLANLPSAVLRGLHDDYTCVSENRRYLLFQAGSSHSGDRPSLDSMVGPRLEALLVQPSQSVHPRLRTFPWRDRAILVTTFERAAALERSLPQLSRLNAPTLLVDDGSRALAAERNRALAREHGVEYLRLPSNRGISAALNVGLEYLLADSSLRWISYFQDDVDVHIDALERLHLVEDTELRPLLTGYDADEHPALEEAEVNGLNVRLKGETAGVHLHAHRDYWRAVLPIPTIYLGAPKRRWGASLEDSWIAVGAPKSVAHRGIPVVCLPGLVRTFLWHPGDSTWGNPNEPEPLLEADSVEAVP